MCYDKIIHSIVTDDVSGYCLERVKGDIRRMPNKILYDALIDNFRPFKDEDTEPKIRIKPKVKVIVRRK